MPSNFGFHREMVGGRRLRGIRGEMLRFEQYNRIVPFRDHHRTPDGERFRCEAVRRFHSPAMHFLPGVRMDRRALGLAAIDIKGVDRDASAGNFERSAHVATVDGNEARVSGVGKREHTELLCLPLKVVLDRHHIAVSRKVAIDVAIGETCDPCKPHLARRHGRFIAAYLL